MFENFWIWSPKVTNTYFENEPNYTLFHSKLAVEVLVNSMHVSQKQNSRPLSWETWLPVKRFGWLRPTSARNSPRLSRINDIFNVLAILHIHLYAAISMR